MIILGPRATAGFAKVFIVVAILIGALWLLASASQLSNGAQYAIVIGGAALLLWLSRRPYAPPMTAEEREADFQATKAREEGH
jgi:hypothetical protein